ncbi:MAG: TonB-dependent receptor, partial [Gammaproteobacteria bacterium]|nr:TonB-dependent receptor [Gammaproteobacteria bacterium]
MLRIAILLLVVAGIHGAPALADETSGQAQTQEENEHTPAGGASLEEIRVTAHPFSETDEHMVRPAQVLSKEELRTRSISSIGETVANEPGVTSSDYGTGVGRPVIRGQSGNRVLILEDGLSTMDAGSFSADHAVTTETILSQQVEILQGPATLLYGSGGSGGIINIVKGRILDYVPDDVEGEVALQYETVSDGMTGAGRLNFGVGNFAFHIDGMARDTDDYNIPGFAELEPGESTRGTLANSSRKTENISGGLSWVGARGYAGFSVSRYENEYGIPGHHHDHGHDHGHGHEHGGHDDHDDHDDEDEHHDDDDDHGHDDEDEHHDDDDDHGHDDEDEHHDDD